MSLPFFELLIQIPISIRPPPTPLNLLFGSTTNALTTKKLLNRSRLANVQIISAPQVGAESGSQEAKSKAERRHKHSSHS